MDRELEDQINDLINKSNKDLKTRIVRIVVRYQNKLLKEQARELKTSASNGGKNSSPLPDRRSIGRTTGRNSSPPLEQKSTCRSSGRRSSKKDDKYSDSDSDGYYSD